MIQKAKNRNLISKENNSNFTTQKPSLNKVNKSNPTPTIDIKIPQKKSPSDKIQFLSNHLPAKYLNNLILNDYFEYFTYLKKIENFNLILSEYLIRKKINIREIEVRMKNEEMRKEKESLMIKKNLEDKVESVLEKANSCLENIKNLGKKIPVNSVEKNKINKNSSITTTVKNTVYSDPLKSVISNLGNKYNSEIFINEENLNFYFSLVAKNRKSIKDLKDKYKRFNNKNKSARDIFNKIYSVNKINKNSQILEKNENFEKSQIFEKNEKFAFSSILYKQLDMILHPMNLIHSDLFEKLFMKILFLKNSYKQSDIYDIFSFWYYLKNIKGKLAEIENYKLDTVIMSNLASHIIKIDLVSSSENKKEKNYKIFENLALKNLGRYFQSLFKKSIPESNKTNTNSHNEIKEDEIFDKNFYSLYDSLLKMNRIKYIKMILQLVQEVNSEMYIPKNANQIKPEQKDECLFLKSIYSLIANNGSFSYQISKIN
jgi:hypothetical protein